jgi:MFS superfamily sulfate permease-like transporter
MQLALMRQLLRPALILAIVSYMITISIGNTFALKHGYEVQADQELLALGLSNVMGAFFQAYPSSGSLSRSAVASAAGARSPLHGLVKVTTWRSLWPDPS